MSKKKKMEYLGSFDITNRLIKIILSKVTPDSSVGKLEILNYTDMELHPWNDEDEYIDDVFQELLSRAEAKSNLKNIEYAGFPISLESPEATYMVKEITIPVGSSVLIDDQVLKQINEEAAEKFEKDTSKGHMLQDYIIGYKINGEFFPDIKGKEVEMVNVILGATYIPNKMVNLIQKCLDLLNLNDYVFEYSPISAAYFIPSESKELGCFQLHGSWQEFDLIYWYRDKILDLKKLPYGMRMLSKDVEKVFKMSRDVAENLIFNDFKSLREEDISEGVISVTLKNGEKTEISRQFFQRVLEARMDEIAELLLSLADKISKNILKSYGINTNYDKIYLTGSFLNLKGTKTLLKRYFKNSDFYVPSVEDTRILIMGEKNIISNAANLPLFANVINHYNNSLFNTYNRNKTTKSNKEKDGFFKFFKKRRRD
jgi:cell division ATPase FtsA